MEKIVHKKGYLPPDLQESLIETSLREVFQLCMVLANKIRQIDADPFFNEIADSVSKKYDHEKPSIEISHKRHIIVELLSFKARSAIEKEVLESASIEIGNKLKEWNKQFDPKSDLIARFSIFNEGQIDTYKKCELLIREEQV